MIEKRENSGDRVEGKEERKKVPDVKAYRGGTGSE